MLVNCYFLFCVIHVCPGNSVKANLGSLGLTGPIQAGHYGNTRSLDGATVYIHIYMCISLKTSTII